MPYSVKDVDNMMTKLNGLIAANDPETIARYVNDVATVTNSPSIQDLLSKEERQTVIIISCYTACITALSDICRDNLSINQ